MHRFATCFLIAVFLSGCQLTRIQREAVPGTDRVQVSNEAARADGLQAHLLGGEVVVFETWEVVGDQLVGVGARYDAYRTSVRTGQFDVPLDSVAIVVADREVPSEKRIVGLSIVTGLSAALSVFCLTNTKACFGSCPTFYAEDADGQQRLVAEGYSASIAPSAAARDVDALAPAVVSGPEMTLRMTNEAMETHITRRADLLLVPRPTSGRVYFEGHGTDDGRFWLATSERSPTACEAAEGDCRDLLASADGRERFSRADSTDLGARESITLAFDAPGDGPLGLVLHGRQSLMTTFLVYQGLAYAGEDIGGWIAQAETRARDGDPLRSGVLDLVSEIAVDVRGDDGTWQEAGTVAEVGPIAPDAHLVVLPELAAGPVEVRLRLTRGAWRLDRVALAALGGTVEAVRLSPSDVLRETPEGPIVPDAEELADLTDDGRSLVTLPGTALRLVYRLPPLPEGASAWEPFLEAEGYYLEWMREEWMSERDPDALAELLFTPERALRRLAPAFSAMEADMEAAFWGSRFAVPAAPPLSDL